uniref:Uncharacterized protein n=1 Tax=Arundo donax TaxID=35708 RepID=A0A0A9AG71_ARUDO
MLQMTSHPSAKTYAPAKYNQESSTSHCTSSDLK